MKKIILALAIASAFPAFAQDSTSSGTASSSSSSSPTVNTSSGNSSSTVNASGSASANPNNANAQQVIFNTTGGGTSTVDSTSHNTSDGTQRVITEGGTTNRNINEGVSEQRVVYSGTQTIKNVPGIQMSGPASGPCTGVSGGVGLAGPGWGVGFNGSGVMDDCRIRENTRVLGMAMQSIDGGAQPQEKGELTVLFMEAARGLAAYNRQILDGAIKQEKK